MITSIKIIQSFESTKFRICLQNLDFTGLQSFVNQISSLYAPPDHLRILPSSLESTKFFQDKESVWVHLQLHSSGCSKDLWGGQVTMGVLPIYIQYSYILGKFRVLTRFKRSEQLLCRALQYQDILYATLGVWITLVYSSN